MKTTVCCQGTGITHYDCLLSSSSNLCTAQNRESCIQMYKETRNVIKINRFWDSVCQIIAFRHALYFMCWKVSEQ